VVGQGYGRDKLFALHTPTFFDNVPAYNLGGWQGDVFFEEDGGLLFSEYRFANTQINRVWNGFRDVLVFWYRSFV
jgi:hypothetical protein